jgi:hypothetical protein
MPNQSRRWNVWRAITYEGRGIAQEVIWPFCMPLEPIYMN